MAGEKITFKKTFKNRPLRESNRGASTLGESMPRTTFRITGLAYPYNSKLKGPDTSVEPIGVSTNKGVNFSWSVLFKSQYNNEDTWKQFVPEGAAVTALTNSDKDVASTLVGVTFTISDHIVRNICTPTSYEEFKDKENFTEAEIADLYSRVSTLQLRTDDPTKVRPMYYYVMSGFDVTTAGKKA